MQCPCRVAKLPSASLKVASGQLLLGKVLLRQGDAPAAEAAYRLCLATREERLGLQHPDTAAAVQGAWPYIASSIPTYLVDRILYIFLGVWPYAFNSMAPPYIYKHTFVAILQDAICYTVSCTGLAFALDAQEKASQPLALATIVHIAV